MMMNSKETKLYMIPRTLGPFNVFILLNGWICLHGVLDSAGFWTHFKSLHFSFHFISFHMKIEALTLFAVRLYVMQRTVWPWESCPSVRPSVKHVDRDKTTETEAQIFIP